MEQELKLLRARVDELRRILEAREPESPSGPWTLPSAASLSIQVAEVERLWTLQRLTARDDWRVVEIVGVEPPWRLLPPDRRRELVRVLIAYSTQMRLLVTGADGLSSPPPRGSDAYRAWRESYCALRRQLQDELAEFPNLDPWSPEYVVEWVTSPEFRRLD